MIIENAKQFGQLILERRKALGMTQKELALAVNVGERFVVELERGKETCQLARALRIARGVGIRLTDSSRRETGMSGGYDLPDLA